MWKNAAGRPGAAGRYPFGKELPSEMTSHSTSRPSGDAGQSNGLSSRAPRGVPGDGAPVEVTLLLFAAAREAAGCSRWQLRGVTVTDVLAQARARFGEAFGAVLDGSKVWVNGEPVLGPEPLRGGDEVAVLPPVSGG